MVHVAFHKGNRITESRVLAVAMTVASHSAIELSVQIFRDTLYT